MEKAPHENDMRKREILLTFGKTGMGKSNYLKGLLSSLSRVIILDPLDEYPVREFTDLDDMITFLENNKTFKVKSTNIQHLDGLGEIVDSMQDVTLLIEEAQRCIPPSTKDLPDSLQRIIFCGRHYGRSLAIAAQRPSIVHIAARSQWTRIVSFNITEEADTKWIKSTSGYEVLEENDIRKLPVGEYFEITPGSFERKRAPLYIPRRKEVKSNIVRIEDWFSALNFSR